MRKYALLMLLALSACAHRITPEQQLSADRTSCSNYGYKQGTKDFSNCMLIVDQNRKQLVIQQQQADAMNTQSSAAMLGVSNAFINAGKPTYAPSATGFSCTTTGNTTNCH